MLLGLAPSLADGPPPAALERGSVPSAAADNENGRVHVKVKASHVIIRAKVEGLVYAPAPIFFASNDA